VHLFDNKHLSFKYKAARFFIVAADLFRLPSIILNIRRLEVSVATCVRNPVDKFSSMIHNHIFLTDKQLFNNFDKDLYVHVLTFILHSNNLFPLNCGFQSCKHKLHPILVIARILDASRYGPKQGSSNILNSWFCFVGDILILCSYGSNNFKKYLFKVKLYSASVNHTAQKGDYVKRLNI
jgi:hypothetical protein